MGMTPLTFSKLSGAQGQKQDPSLGVEENPKTQRYLVQLTMPLTLFYMGFLGVGNAWGGGAESAHPLQNVSKAYLSYKIDVKQLFSALLLDKNSLRGQNYHFG